MEQQLNLPLEVQAAVFTLFDDEEESWIEQEAQALEDE